MSIGAKLTHTGPVDPVDVPGMAMALEAAGFASAWVSDHVVMPQTIASRYPFAADGRATWSPRVPYLEAVTVLAAAAAVTSTIRLGTAVLVLPQRNPVLTAKQLATVSALSGGRLSVGVGAGWLREEFDALHAPFEGRGANLETWVDVLRDCWTGAPPERREGYPLPAGMLALPAPADADSGPVRRPLAAGARSGRAGSVTAGWPSNRSPIWIRPCWPLSSRRSPPPPVAPVVLPARSPACCGSSGSSGRENEVAARLAELADAGVDEVIVDVDPAVGSGRRVRRSRRRSRPVTAASDARPAGARDRRRERDRRRGRRPDGGPRSRRCRGGPPGGRRSVVRSLGRHRRRRDIRGFGAGRSRRSGTPARRTRRRRSRGRHRPALATDRGDRPRRLGPGSRGEHPWRGDRAETRGADADFRRDHHRCRVAELVAGRPQHRGVRSVQARRARTGPLGRHGSRPARGTGQRRRPGADRDGCPVRADGRPRGQRPA